MAVTERDILMGPRGKKVITHMATKAQLTKIESPFKFWHSPCIQHWKEVNFCLGIGKKVKKWKKKKFLEKWPFLRQSGTWKSSITINIFGKLKYDANFVYLGPKLRVGALLPRICPKLATFGMSPRKWPVPPKKWAWSSRKKVVLSRSRQLVTKSFAPSTKNRIFGQCLAHFAFLGDLGHMLAFMANLMSCATKKQCEWGA